MNDRQRWFLALVATSTMAVSYVDRQTLAVLAPSVTADLGISDTMYGWLASAFSIAYLVGAPLAGRWIDRVGARRGLMTAVIVWSVIAALHALAPGFAVLFALRILLGLAEAPSFPGASQTMHRALPAEHRARGYGILFTGSSFGAMIAPPLAAGIAAVYGWRVAFVGTAIVGLIWVPIWWKAAYHPAAREVLDKPPESPGAATTDDASKSPAGDTRIFLHPAVLRGALLIVASAPAISFVLNWGAKYLVREQSLTQTQVGAYLWLPPVMFDLGSVIFGDLASRRAKKRGHDGAPDRLLVALAAVIACAIVLMPYTHTPWATMFVAGVGLVGGGGLYAIGTADMISRVPARAVSQASGFTAAAQSLALIIANPLIGAGVDHWGSYYWITIALGAWIVPGAIGWILWKPPAISRP